MKRFKNILYVNESCVDQDSTVARAVALAKSDQVDLTVMDVIPTESATIGFGLPPDGPISTKLREDIIADRWSALNSLFQPYAEQLRIQFRVSVGKRFIDVIRAVLKNKYDLVIKPAEIPYWTHRLFGSDDLHLLRKCPCPVWLVKPSDKSTYSNILAAVDFDPLEPLNTGELNRRILELAGSLALSEVASLHIVHAWEASSEKGMASIGLSSKDINKCIEDEHKYHRQNLQRLGDKLRIWFGEDAYDDLSPNFHLPRGSAKERIAPLAMELEADLVVMGTVARTSIPGFFMGNTAESILDQLACSVLAVKPPGFRTPVKED